MRKSFLAIGILAIVILSVAVSPKASAVIGTLLDNLENGWTYSETDTNGCFSDGGNVTDWYTEGAASRKMIYTDGTEIVAGDNMTIYKTLDLTGKKALSFDYNKTLAGGGGHRVLFQLQIDGNTVWTAPAGSVTEYGVQVDTTAYNDGTHTLAFTYIHTGGDDWDEPSGSIWVDNLRDISLWTIELRWEETYGLIPNDEIENYRITFFSADNTTLENAIGANQDNFAVQPNIQKIRVDDTEENYWRTRIVADTENLTTTIIMVDNVAGMDQYEFTLRDLTGLFGHNHDGQLWFSRYIESNKLYIHEDYWDAEETVAVFLVYGEEYSLKLVTSAAERSYGRIVADGILSKEISVATFTLPDPQMIWDYVGWSAWFDNEDNLKVSYQDNQIKTDNVTVNIYDENDNRVHTETFTTNQWTMTWTGALENASYTVELNINHQTHGNLITSTVSSPAWVAPLIEEGGLPGISLLGSMPFAWGSAVAFIFVLAIALTFGARHAGLCVFSIGLVLIMLGPIMGFFQVDTTITGLIAFLLVIGIIMMLTKGGE